MRISGNTGNKVRLVFRVKTNRGFDDMGAAYSSLGRGAVQIDDVVVNASNIGDFEGSEQGGVNTIDNRTGASPLTNWKSTGKPPAILFHPRALADLTYNDLCGPPESPARFCNIYGTVISAGNFDDGERAGDSRFLSDREIQHGMFSPTINFTTDPLNPTTPNSQGLTASMIDVTDDYYVWYDLYAGIFNLNFTGNAWVFGSMCYPATMNNGGKIAILGIAPTGFKIVEYVRDGARLIGRLIERKGCFEGSKYVICGLKCDPFTRFSLCVETEELVRHFSNFGTHARFRLLKRRAAQTIEFCVGPFAARILLKRRESVYREIKFVVPCIFDLQKIDGLRPHLFVNKP